MAPTLSALLASGLSFTKTPFALFGHSMGALLAYELAIELSNRNIPPKKLFVSGSLAPRRQSARGIHTLNDIEFVEELKRLNGTPEAVIANQELMDIVLPILRADFAIAETYARQEVIALPCPITAFSGIEDINNSKQVMENWARFTSADLESYAFPGDHFFIQTEEALVLDQLKTSLLENS